MTHIYNRCHGAAAVTVENRTAFQSDLAQTITFVIIHINRMRMFNVSFIFTSVKHLHT